MLGIVVGIGRTLQQKRCNFGFSAKTWFLGKTAGTEHSAALNCDFKKCRCWEEPLEECFCNSSAQYELQMSCIWTTENFVSLFCNLDAVLHLLLPPVRFLSVWHIWKPFRLPFGLTSKAGCCVHRQAPNISQGWVVLFCPPTMKPGNGRRTGEPSPPWFLFPGWKGWKGLSGALHLVQRFLPAEALHRHPQSEVPLGILDLQWK